MVQQLGLTKGRVVDLGGGSGTQSIAMTKLGFIEHGYVSKRAESDLQFYRQLGTEDQTSPYRRRYFGWNHDNSCYFCRAKSDPRCRAVDRTEGRFRPALTRSHAQTAFATIAIRVLAPGAVQAIPIHLGELALGCL